MKYTFKMRVQKVQQKQQMEKFRPYHNKINKNASPNKANFPQQSNGSNKKASQAGSIDQLTSLQQKLLRHNPYPPTNYSISQNDYYGEKITNKNNYQSDKKVVIRQIQFLRGKIQSLESKSTHLKQEIQYQKNIYKANSGKLESIKQSQNHKIQENHLRTIEALEKKVQIIVKQISITIKNLSSTIQDKFNSRQNQNRKIYEQCSKIRSAYSKNLQSQQQLYKQQLNSLVEQVRSRQKEYIKRIQGIQLKRNQMIQQYGKRESEYLNQIFLLQEKIRSIADKGTSLFRNKQMKRPNLKLKSANFEYAIIGALQNRIQQIKVSMKVSPTKDQQYMKKIQQDINPNIGSKSHNRQPEIVYLRQRVSGRQQIELKNSIKQMDQLPILKRDSKQSSQSIESLLEYSQSLVQNQRRQSQQRNSNLSRYKNEKLNLQKSNRNSDSLKHEVQKYQDKVQDSIFNPLSYTAKSKSFCDESEVMKFIIPCKSDHQQTFTPLDKTTNSSSKLYKGSGTRNWEKFSEDQGSQQDIDQFY